MSQSLDWEVYRTARGYRAELCRGSNPQTLTTIRSRWRPMLYAKMLVTQWWHR